MALQEIARPIVPQAAAYLAGRHRVESRRVRVASSDLHPTPPAQAMGAPDQAAADLARGAPIEPSCCSDLHSAKSLLEVARELRIRSSGVACELLDGVGREVAVALAVGLRVLVQGIGLPFREAH